jgi:hypothetical protein
VQYKSDNLGSSLNARYLEYGARFFPLYFEAGPVTAIKFRSFSRGNMIRSPSLGSLCSISWILFARLSLSDRMGGSVVLPASLFSVGFVSRAEGGLSAMRATNLLTYSS